MAGFAFFPAIQSFLGLFELGNSHAKKALELKQVRVVGPDTNDRFKALDDAAKAVSKA
jgi:hypothetical protein